jgi:hypothetical protein
MEQKVTKKKRYIQGYNNKNTEEFVYALVEVSIKTKHCYMALRVLSGSICHRSGTAGSGRPCTHTDCLISLSLLSVSNSELLRNLY